MRLTEPKVPELVEEKLSTPSRPRRNLKRRRIIESTSPVLGSAKSHRTGTELPELRSASNDDEVLQDLEVQVSQHSSFPRYLYPIFRSSPRGRKKAPSEAASQSPAAQNLQASGNTPIIVSSDLFVPESSPELQQSTANLEVTPRSIPASSNSYRATIAGQAGTESQKTSQILRSRVTTKPRPTFKTRSGEVVVQDSQSATEFSLSGSGTAKSKVTPTRLSGSHLDVSQRGDAKPVLASKQILGPRVRSSVIESSGQSHQQTSSLTQQIRLSSAPIRQSPRFQTQIPLLSDSELLTQTSKSHSSKGEFGCWRNQLVESID